MTDLMEDPDDGPKGANAPEFSVSDLSGAIKKVLEGSFGRVRVRGEIGRISRPASGHLYYNLKDAGGSIDAVTWRGMVSSLGIKPEEGMEVIATGRLTTFASGSKYQLVVDGLEPAGAGALMAMLEKLRTQLAAEGLFAEARKRPLPFLPSVIGVVTSPSGAVIRDILHRLRDRFPVRVLVWPVPVQGEGCAPAVARAIRGFDALAPDGPVPRPDVVIVARGGGSMEDLWGFNAEEVVRAAADCRIPLISAVGHETDTTLIDFAADRRAPTPTAAAEMAVPMRRDLVARIATAVARLDGAMARGAAQRDRRLRDLARALPRPEALTGPARQRFDLWGSRLSGALRLMVETKSRHLQRAAGGLRVAALVARVGQSRAELEARADRLARAADRRRQEAGQRGALLAARLAPALDRRVQDRRREVAALAGRLSGQSRFVALPTARRELARLETRQAAAWAAGQDRRGQRLAAAERLRQSLGYRQTLARGFAVVRAGERVLTRAAQAGAETGFEIEFADGRIAVEHLPDGGPGTKAETAPDGSTGGGPKGGPEGGAQPSPPGRPARARKPEAPSPSPRQGSLF